MENAPGEQFGQVMQEGTGLPMPGGAIVTPEVNSGAMLGVGQNGEAGQGAGEAMQNASVGLGEAARGALGSAALMTAGEMQRPVEARMEGLQGGSEAVVPASEVLVEAPVAEIGTLGVDGQDVIRDAQGDFTGTDKPEKRRAAAEKAYVERAQETRKLVETDPKAAADKMTAESWEYMRVMFGRQMGDGITGQKGGLAA